MSFAMKVRNFFTEDGKAPQMQEMKEFLAACTDDEKVEFERQIDEITGAS